MKLGVVEFSDFGEWISFTSDKRELCKIALRLVIGYFSRTKVLNQFRSFASCYLTVAVCRIEA